MDEKSLICLVLVMIGLWTGLIGIRFLVVWLQLMRMRFAPGDIFRADRSAMPAEVAAILDPMFDRLAALGFAYEETFLAQPMLRYADAQPVWIDVHAHAPSGSRASVQISESPEPGFVAAVSFSTDYEQTMLQTENRRLHLLLPVPDACQLADAAAATLAEHWALHCHRVAEADAGAVITDLECLRQRHRALRAGLFEHCQRIGVMCAAGEQWRFTAAGAWRYLRQVMAGNKRLAVLPPAAEVEEPSLRVAADKHAWQTQEAVTRHNVMSRRGKLLWFAISLLAGATAFGYMISWEMVPLILGVLLFHEFGHALAMRALGYRGLSVLVLPFLGAVAIGRKDDAGPWQKLAVLLAGPLPGLILAVVCLRLSQYHPESRVLLVNIGWMALSLNYFNLLPFTPLDGGQIVDTFLFARRPRLRFGFFLLSIGALFAVAYALDSTPLAGAALLLALGISGGWQRMRLLKDLKDVAPGDASLSALLEHMHVAPGPRWPAFAQRLQTVRMLLPWLNGRAPTLVESLLGMGIYLAVIALPVALLWGTGMPQQAVSSLSRVGSGYEAAPPDWEKQLAEAATPEARWQVLWQAGQWFEEAENEAQALHLFQLALAESRQLPEDSQKALRVLDARLAVARNSEAELTRSEYLDLLPTLRELPTAECWRLADVQEAMNWLDAQADAATRIERYREAIAARELSPGQNDYRLFYDRVQLARLLDAQGDASAAEALLRKNLAELSGERRELVIWQIGPAIWFLIAHERAAEAEALLAAQPMPAHHSETLRSTLAWTQLAQGKTALARKALAEAVEKMDKQRWNESQRLLLLLDLIHASADAPEEEARWIKEATDLRAAMDPVYRGGRYLLNGDAKNKEWERSRDQARFAAFKRLPGVEDELQAEGRRVCK